MVILSTIALFLSNTIRSGEPPNYQYVNEDDIKSGAIRELTDEEIRLVKEIDVGPDADDLSVFRKKPIIRAASKQQNNKDVIKPKEDLQHQLQTKPQTHLVIF